MFAQLKKTYLSLPEFVKRPIKHLPYAWVAGKNYRTTLAECRRVDQMSREEIRAMQEQRLGETLQFAVEEVPFYRPYRDAVSRYKPGEAIREFPMLTKADVRANYDQLIPRSIHAIPHHYVMTGGTTGQHLEFLEDDATYAREMGFMHSQWGRVGYHPSRRKATFRCAHFHRIGGEVFWQENPIHNELQFSLFHMTEANLSLYVKRLIEYRPEFLHGYASAIDLLSEYIIRQGLSACLPSLKCVLLGSESIVEDQRQRISQAFETRIYSWYGHGERVVLAGECEYSTDYHAFPNYGYLELIKENGDNASEGERGEIVGTGFLNRSLPLIRYRTDDTAIKLGGACRCGRQWELMGEVIGRSSQLFFYNRRREKVSGTAFYQPAAVFKNVKSYQYYQEEAGELVVRVVPNEFFSEQDELMILRKHQEMSHGEFNVSVQRVDQIPLRPNGKHVKLLSVVDGVVMCG